MPTDSQQKEVSFNTPTDELFQRQSNRESPENGKNGGGSNDGEVPRTKRIACVVCRRRKLRCDGVKPSCGTCSRLGHDCAYDEVRRKSGPKRGYVKALEARLAQVESLLKTQDGPTTISRNNAQHGPYDPSGEHTGSRFAVPTELLVEGVLGSLVSGQEVHEISHYSSRHGSSDFQNEQQGSNERQGDDGNFMPDISMDQAMISLEMEEALPAQEIIDDLTNIFFEKCYHAVPMIHKARYYASLQRAPAQRPPICLRYAMWALAATVEEKYLSYRTHFYRKARKAIEDLELLGHGEKIGTVAAIATWNIISCYEFKLMYFPRAWMSTGRASRLAQMMGMLRVDSSAVDVKQCLPEPTDWIEKEERRRVFWVAFVQDRYASIGTGWPMVLDEKDIITCLPCEEDDWQLGMPDPEGRLTLQQAMSPEGASYLTPFGGVIVMASVFGRNLLHLHRPDGDQRFSDPNCDFWVRHRNLDNLLLNITMSLPQRLRLPQGIEDQNIVFTNMNLHAATICLHQAAIFKAEKYGLSSTMVDESKMRSAAAAQQIASIMRTISHLDISAFNPFVSFCLYVAARVFVQCLKIKPNDNSFKSSIEFLLMALRHMRKVNPLTESFLLQLEVDLMGHNIDAPTINKVPVTLRKGEVSVLQCGSQYPQNEESTARHREFVEKVGFHHRPWNGLQRQTQGVQDGEQDPKTTGPNFPRTVFPPTMKTDGIIGGADVCSKNKKDSTCGDVFFGKDVPPLRDHSVHTVSDSQEGLSPNQGSSSATPDSRGFTPISTDNASGRSQGTSNSGYSPMEMRQEEYQQAMGIGASMCATINATMSMDYAGTLIPPNGEEFGMSKDYNWNLMDDLSGSVQQHDPNQDNMTLYSDLF